MKKTVLYLVFFFCSNIAFAQSVNRFHQKAILVDTHNDVLSELTLAGKDISNRLKEGHSDLYRFKEGGVDVQFFSVFTSETARTAAGYYHDAIVEIDSLQSIVNRNTDRMVLARNYAEVKRAIHQKKLAALIGVEGGHMIEDDLSKFQTLYDKGMRYMTLTWNNSTTWASSAMDETSPKSVYNTENPKPKGLTEFGKEVVRKMNELGVIVDLSHVGEQTFYDVLEMVNKPVLLSHSSVYSICPVFRNVKDEQIKAVAKNGGVICINFFSAFISKPFSEKFAELKKPEHPINQNKSLSESAKKQLMDEALKDLIPGISEVIDHIDHIVKLVGINHVGIGSDFDGITYTPKGLEDVTTYPALTKELLKRGYSKRDVKKILGKNVLRVMKANFN